MSKINKLGGISKTLRALAKKRPDVEVVVSFNTDYAVRVHEDLTMPHPRGGQAKFLEQPARELRGDLQDQIREDIKDGISVEQALMNAGLVLQSVAQSLVPVDTGLLKASAQTKIVKS